MTPELTKETPYRDYRETLKRILERRCQANPRYSLRAFARDLGITAPVLTDLFKKRYGFSSARATEVGKKAGLTGEELALFVLSAGAQHSRSKNDRAFAKEQLLTLAKKIQEPNALTLDAFQVISDWYHYAILELTAVEGFKSDFRWISEALGVPEAAIKLAIERLERLGLIEIRLGKYAASTNFVTSPNGIPSEALRKFHRQILSNAIDAIELQDVSERDFSSITMAIDSKRLPEVKERIQKFRRKLNDDLAVDPKKDSVYTIAIQFYRNTKKKNLKNISQNRRKNG